MDIDDRFAREAGARATGILQQHRLHGLQSAVHSDRLY